MLNGFPTFITVTQGDKSYALSFTLQDSVGSVINLAGASVTFTAQYGGDYPVQGGGAMLVTNAAAGQCQYTVQANDFTVVGIWNAQVSVSFSSDSEVITWNQITINVLPSLPQSM